MDDLSLDMSHELMLSGVGRELRRDTQRLAQEGMLPNETGNMGKKRPMRGLRKKAKKRSHYDY